MDSLEMISGLLSDIDCKNETHAILYTKHRYPQEVSSLSVDRLTMFIQNHQLLEQFDSNKLRLIQNDIINHVFGGILPLLQLLLDSFDACTLSTEMHHKLYELLSDNTAVDDEYKCNANYEEKCIMDLPYDCLSHAMRFLTPNERITVQQSNRLLAIAARRDASVNDIDKELPLMGVLPFKRVIIENILSDDEDKNLHALQLCQQYQDDFAPPRYLKYYSASLLRKFEQILIRHKSNPVVLPVIAENCTYLSHKTEALLLPCIMNKLVKLNDGDSLCKIIDRVSSDLKYWNNRYVHQYMTIEGFVESFCDVCLKTKTLVFSTPDADADEYFQKDRESLLEAIYNIFCAILKYKYPQYAGMIIDGGFLDTVAALIIDDGQVALYYLDTLTYLVKSSAEKHVGQILKHNLMNILAEKPMQDNMVQYPQDYPKQFDPPLLRFITSLLQQSNKAQRLIVLEKLQKKITSYDHIHFNLYGRLWKVIKSLNDQDAFSKFNTLWGDIDGGIDEDVSQHDSLCVFDGSEHDSDVLYDDEEKEMEYITPSGPDRTTPQ